MMFPSLYPPPQKKKEKKEWGEGEGISWRTSPNLAAPYNKDRLIPFTDTKHCDMVCKGHKTGGEGED